MYGNWFNIGRSLTAVKVFYFFDGHTASQYPANDPCVQRQLFEQQATGRTILPSLGFVSFKADFHSVQNFMRSILIERFLLKCVNSNTANEFVPLDCLYLKRKRSLKVDRATFCTE